MSANIASSLKDLEVDNVFIYVGDAVRWDYLPDTFLERGMTLKTVAASTHSPTSFASMMTGKNAFEHGVSSFTNRIREDIFRLFDIEGYHTQFINSISHEEKRDPIFSVLRLDYPTQEKELEEMSSPYVIVERGQGGHAPYNSEYSTAAEYFRVACRGDIGNLRDDYRYAVKQDETKFLERVQEFRDDNTLIIYTSDHGELLGEGGMIGHTSPMRPELVYVPTVFIHPEIPTGIFQNQLFRHIDLLPTILDLLDIPEPESNELDGRSIASSTPATGAISRFDHEFLSTNVPRFSGGIHYEGAWDYNGGFVFACSSLIDRLMFLGGKITRSDKRKFLRRNIRDVVQSYSKSKTTYGSPDINQKEAANLIESEKEIHPDTEEHELSDSDLEHLRDLGYR